MSTLQLGEAILFCPGDRPERYHKAIERADRVIVDLEDAVSPQNKAQARAQVMTALPELPAGTIVRINAAGNDFHRDDLLALRRLRQDSGLSPLLMLPKVESAAQLRELDDFAVIALCETAAGALHVEDIAAAENCVALFWGGEDLIASLGGRRSRDDDGRYYPLVEQVRSTVLMAAAAHGKPAIDAVHIDIGDLSGLQREARQAADLGFTAKACIHPSHTAVIRAAFQPNDETRRWAERVIAAMQSAHNGVVSLDGRMIDEPLLRQAQRISGVKPQ